MANETMQDTRNNHRFSLWVSLMAFSVFCLAANLNTDDARERIFFRETQQEPNTKTPQRKWITAMTSISTAVSLFSIVAHFVWRAKFVSTRLEKGAALFLIACWSAGLPVIMNPNNEIAQAGLFIIDYNLYFFSWLAFDMVLMIFASLQQTSAQVKMWSALVICSLVVVGSSTRLYRDSTCTGGLFEVDCERIKWTIGLGASCTAISLLVVVLVSSEMIGIWIEVSVAALIMILYALGVGYITYGNGAGALILGNLYFFVWIGFLVALVMSSDLFYNALDEKRREGASSNDVKEDVDSEPKEQAQDDTKEDVEEAANVEDTAGVMDGSDSF